MLFPTFEFAVFFSLTFLVSWLLRPFPTPWRWFILAMSYVFYAWWDWRFCFLLAVSTIGNWAAAEGIARAPTEVARRTVLVAAVAANLVVLGFFKYYGFFVTSVTDGLSALGIDASPPLLQVILPVGISFFTFQALSYVIDRYRDDTDCYPLLDFAVYLSFFPHLVAGPIVRARELLPQLQERPDPRRVDAALAFRLIFAGLFKKVVISSFVAGAAVDEVFAVPGQFRSLEILVAIYAYAIQIYADFSGYTDIAIGCALLLGLRFPQNFDAPYTARSIQDFWRRWHITLSTWLRDYVYIPLGGNQRGARRTSINLFLTMLLGGLWHGAAWTFVVWGAIHGGAMTVERSLTARRERDRELPFAGGGLDERQLDAAVLVGSQAGVPVGSDGRPGREPPPAHGLTDALVPPSPAHGLTDALVPLPPAHGPADALVPPSPAHGLTDALVPPSPAHGPADALVPPPSAHGSTVPLVPPSPAHGPADALVPPLPSRPAGLSVSSLSAHGPAVLSAEPFHRPVVRWLVTFHVVCLAWVFFRAETLGDAFELLWRLVSAPGSGPVVKPMLLFVIVVMLASQFVPSDAVDRVQAAFSRWPFVAQGAALGVGLLVIDALGPVGVAPFIYFQF